MSSILDKEIELFLESAVKCICMIDFRTFDKSANWYSYDPLIAKSWTKRILKMIDDCEKSQLSYRKIASLFPNMSQLRCTMTFDLWMSKYSKTSPKDREKIFQFYSSLLNAYCLEDSFAFEKNIIHSQKQIRKLATKLKSASPMIAKTLGRLVSACYHLGFAMYSDMNPQSVYENYGPYYYDKGIIAIKEFGNLRAKGLWPESQIVPCNFIKICCFYKNVTMTVDLTSHVVYKGDLINNLRKFNLEIDGKEYPVTRLNEISKIIEKAAINIFKKFQSLDFESYKQKYFFQKAYVYKNLYEKLGQNWRPSEDILSEARNKPHYKVNWPKDKNKQKEMIRKILDPRIDYKI